MCTAAGNGVSDGATGNKLLDLFGLAWGVAIAPQRQPLEGALQASALSSALQPRADGTSQTLQGFLVLRCVRSLTD
jgi:hypothetical protein